MKLLTKALFCFCLLLVISLSTGTASAQMTCYGPTPYWVDSSIAGPNGAGCYGDGTFGNDPYMCNQNGCLLFNNACNAPWVFSYNMGGICFYQNCLTTGLNPDYYEFWLFDAVLHGELYADAEFGCDMYSMTKPPKPRNRSEIIEARYKSPPIKYILPWKHRTA